MERGKDIYTIETEAEIEGSRVKGPAGRVTVGWAACEPAGGFKLLAASRQENWSA